MNRQETQKILAVIAATYPNYHPESKSAAVDAWTMAFADVPYEQVSQGLAMYMRTERTGFAPSPGQIMGQLDAARRAAIPAAGEAWNLVARAMRNSAYHAADEFARLPESVQRVIGSPTDLREMAMSDESRITTYRAQFTKAYECEINRQSWANSLPESIRERLAQVTRLALEG